MMLTHLQGVKLLPPTISPTLLSTFVTITTSLCPYYWQPLCNHYHQTLSLLLTTYYRQPWSLSFPKLCHYSISLSPLPPILISIIDNLCNHYHQPLSLLSTLVTITTNLCHYYYQPFVTITTNLCHYYCPNFVTITTN